jgi:stage V sporulation protein R
MSTTIRAGRPLFEGADWEFGTIERVHEAVSRIALDELGLNIYPNQIEVISTEQMLDAYSSVGMPLFYKHWSFGKHFARNEAMYRAGMQGLAYEIVINSNPCISYIMEENTAMMQTLVIAHAAFGHNHFFKNNYLFQQWTDADGILDYLEFAKSYIAQCEERYGEAAVEHLLDAAHALMTHGVHRFPRRRPADLRSEERRARERREHDESVFNDLWRTVPGKEKATEDQTAEQRRRALLELPQENILYFLEKTAPRLQPWQREILRIVRQVAQYFYPQSQTKLMNEGCATYVHYRIMTRLHETGQLTDGAMMEFLKSHTNVVFQPEYDDPRYSGINPYFPHLPRADRRGHRLVPRHRRRRRPDAGTARHLGELPRRELCPAIPQPAPDPPFRPVQRGGRRQRFGIARGGDPRRTRLQAHPARAGEAIRRGLDRTRHPGGRRQPRHRPAADRPSPRP